MVDMVGVVLGTYLVRTVVLIMLWRFSFGVLDLPWTCFSGLLLRCLPGLVLMFLFFWVD